tara:strand:+ start:361 stop:1362 length:1002 start_codon:yes stop_codon:yes gene_type:complete
VKINFITNNPDDNAGSYRIWVRDLSRTFNEINVKSKIFTLDSLDKIDKDSSVIVLCKSAYKVCNHIKDMFPDTLIGAINIDCNYNNKNIDFVIVGSIEEYTSMSYYKEVYIYPLIERKFENIKIKSHTNKKDYFNICFHGHYPHLFKFEPFLKSAIERFNKEIKPVNLKIITGNKDFNWKAGKPKVNIEMHDYSEDFVSIVQECDVGIVPNVTDVRLFVDNLQKQTSTEYGLYDTDFFLRMKNKTNAGRAYVLYQLGIPVIHDLSPSSFELLCKTGYNICAHDERSYFREMKKLSSHELRNEVAIKNREIFDAYYNPADHARKLIKKIKETIK